MRASILRALIFVAVFVAFLAAHQARALAQGPARRPLAVAIEPLITTRLEALLTEPNLVLLVDYYWIDMRFGPNMRVDAVIAEAVDSKTRVKGLRVQVRDPESRSRQEGTSFIDLDELTRLSRALTSMSDLAARWTLDDRRATELSFTTAGGFRLAIRHSARVPRAYLSTGLIDPVVTSIELADLPTLKQAFDQALAILNGK